MRVSEVPRGCGGHHPVGDAASGPIRLAFNSQVRVEFRGATVTSDAGLLLPRDLDRRLGCDALIEPHLTDPRSGHNRQFPLPDLLRQAHLPTMHAFRFFVDAGGLMSYGATQSEIYSMAAEQVARILDGARPSELPLRQATRFELVINNRTAKALGLTIPPSLLLRADEIIE
jgi:hypothetical protein